MTIDADTQGTGYKFYTRFEGNGGIEVDHSVEAPETYFDARHTYVFDFGADGSTQVRVDGALTFETAAEFFDYDIDDQFAVLLGGRSYNATTNLYDSIQVTKLPEPSSSFLLAAGLFGLAVRRRFERLA